MEKLPVDNNNHNELNNANIWSDTEATDKVDSTADHETSTDVSEQSPEPTSVDVEENKKLTEEVETATPDPVQESTQPTEGRAPEYRSSTYNDLHNADTKVEKRGHRKLVVAGIGVAAVAALTAVIFTGNAGAAKSTEAKPAETAETVQPQETPQGEMWIEDSEGNRTYTGQNDSDIPFSTGENIEEDYVSPEIDENDEFLTTDEVANKLGYSSISDAMQNDSGETLSYVSEWMRIHGYDGNNDDLRSDEGNMTASWQRAFYIDDNLFGDVRIECSAKDGIFDIYMENYKTGGGSYTYQSSEIPSRDELTNIIVENLS